MCKAGQIATVVEPVEYGQNTARESAIKVETTYDFWLLTDQSNYRSVKEVQIYKRFGG